MRCRRTVEWHFSPTLPLLYVQGRESETKYRQDPHSRDNKGHGTGVVMASMASLHWRIALTQQRRYVSTTELPHGHNTMDGPTYGMARGSMWHTFPQKNWHPPLRVLHVNMPCYRPKTTLWAKTTHFNARVRLPSSCCSIVRQTGWRRGSQ